MQSPNFGEILLDAVKTDITLVWAHWPTWSHDQPIIWVIPAAIVLSLAQSVRPKRRHGQ
ncbi:hypothetical protein [Curtobacterium sp. L1-20]|uniref:hypothetical protein n=1 Tax=Curtobacterium sp. L1-20 TaxID=3138181 RepID=UPI003B529BDC